VILLLTKLNLNRRLSLKYHPDKNPDDPNAAAKFHLLTKAHDCLTDEKARENCEKFGNPDGPGTFSVRTYFKPLIG
jgi:DnaJ-class molecular chaperone with C-terminal Zn finger domain